MKNDKLNTDWNKYSSTRKLGRNRLLKEAHGDSFYDFLEYFKSIPGETSIIDIGCSSGFFLVLLRELGFENIRGLDISEYAVSNARKKNLDVEVLDIINSEKIPDSWPRAEIVLLMDVLEHINRPEEYLKIVRESILKKGGIIYLTVPLYDSITEKIKRVFFNITSREMAVMHDPSHVQAFTGKSLGRLLAKSHFEIIDKKRYYCPIPKIKNTTIKKTIQLLLPDFLKGSFIRVSVREISSRTLLDKKLSDLDRKKSSIKKEDFNREVHDEITKLQGKEFFIKKFFLLDESYQKNRVSQLLETARVRGDDIVMDIGSWVGTFAFHSAKKSKKSIAVDYSFETLRTGHEIILSEYPSLKNKIYFIQGDVSALPFKNNTADVIFSCDCIEHLTKTLHKKYISELMRIMKKSGKMVLHSPNRIHFKAKDIILKLFSKKYRAYVERLKKNPTMEDPLYNISHIGLTDPVRVKRIIRKNGFMRKFEFIINKYNFYVPKISRYAFSRPLEAIIKKIPLVKWLFCDKWSLVLYGEDYKEHKSIT